MVVEAQPSWWFFMNMLYEFVGAGWFNHLTTNQPLLRMVVKVSSLRVSRTTSTCLNMPQQNGLALGSTEHDLVEIE